MHNLSSLSASMRSHRSSNTLVGSDGGTGMKKDIFDGHISKRNKYTLWDLLLRAFGIKRREGYDPIPAAMPIETRERQALDDSPYILPVYVLSLEMDQSEHRIPKEGKCTVDTGNLQGNIVSKAFAMDVLGYTESNFQPLTSLEEAGGIGITGHKLIPLGAAYLTWYHNTSTKVFRDVRFLVSENPRFDLVICAQFIHQNGILDIPNLGNGITMYNKEKGKEKLDRLRDVWNDEERKLQDIEFKELEGDEDPALLTKLESQRSEAKKAHDDYNAENRRFQLKRYWTEKGKGNADPEKLKIYQNEWEQNFPGVEIPENPEKVENRGEQTPKKAEKVEKRD